ncbi:MAG: hypothetical protein JWQ71_1585 [Pedosphaera sp.]|nr:hypothetical protein [Pedosphaera sp.]
MYKIIGANQTEYGPVTADQIRQWIAEGRATTQTLAQMEGETGWKPLSEFPEFAGNFAAAPPTGNPPAFGAAPLDDTGRARALRAVSGPAISLMVAGAISILVCLLSLIVSQSRLTPPPRFSQTENSSAQRAGYLVGSLGAPIVGIISWAFVIFGALKMKKLQSRGLAIAASIVAMLPCGWLCCVVGIPLGIWSLVILNKPEIKGYFSN